MEKPDGDDSTLEWDSADYDEEGYRTVGCGVRYSTWDG